MRLVDLYTMFPFNDKYVLMTMQGGVVYSMMEHAYVSRNAPSNRFLQVSGK